MVYACKAAARLLPRASFIAESRAAHSLWRKRPLSTAVATESWLYDLDFNSLTVLQLKEMCRLRRLRVSGNKLNLQERLQADICKIEDAVYHAGEDSSSTVRVERSTSGLPHAESAPELEPALSPELTEPVQELSAELATKLLPLVEPELVPVVMPVVPERLDGFCFDRAFNYKLVPAFELEQQGRMGTDAMLSPTMTVQDETTSLLSLLPEELAVSLEDPFVRSQLMEVVLDVGRRPFAWVNGKRLFLVNDCDYRLSQEQLLAVLGNLRFGADNRAGINGSLHRISAIRNRDGLAVGATLRNGRYVHGNAIMIADLLLGSNCSILFVGPPGSAKTSIIRDAARLLADDHNVVIVDTSSEIGGAGDIPHECIGQSRRMQVKHIDVQATVMVECVQNHTPSVMVIDEIGRPAEVSAALTCKERGVRIIASAHGNLPGLAHLTPHT